MKTPEEIADFIWGQHSLGHDEMAINDEMYWEDFVAWIKDEAPVVEESNSDGIEIKTIKFSDFLVEMKSRKTEGIVCLGCGGKLQEWVNGVSESLNGEGITSGDPKELWQNMYMLVTTGGRVDLAMEFKEGHNFDIGKMAMWRLRFGDCSWISDYLVNYKDQHGCG